MKNKLLTSPELVHMYRPIFNSITNIHVHLIYSSSIKNQDFPAEGYFFRPYSDDPSREVCLRHFIW